MKKEPYFAFPSKSSELLAHEKEVKVVNPDEVVFLKHGPQGVCIPAIDAPVCSVRVRADLCALNETVEDGPEGAV